jgi:hypothetical protein
MRKLITHQITVILIFSIVSYSLTYFFLTLLIKRELVIKILIWGAIAQLFLFSTYLLIEFIKRQIKKK